MELAHRFGAESVNKATIYAMYCNNMNRRQCRIRWPQFVFISFSLSTLGHHYFHFIKWNLCVITCDLLSFINQRKLILETSVLCVSNLFIWFRSLLIHILWTDIQFQLLRVHLNVDIAIVGTLRCIIRFIFIIFSSNSRVYVGIYNNQNRWLIGD